MTDFSLFLLDKLLFSLSVLWHTLVPRLEAFDHLFWLPAHRFWFESAPLSLLNDPLLLQVHNFIWWLLRIPQVALMIGLFRLISSWCAITPFFPGWWSMTESYTLPLAIFRMTILAIRSVLCLFDLLSLELVLDFLLLSIRLWCPMLIWFMLRS